MCSQASGSDHLEIDILNQKSQKNLLGQEPPDLGVVDVTG